MSARRYHMTRSALADLDDALDYTARRFGLRKAITYRDELLAAMQAIADGHESIGTAHRRGLAAGTDFAIHRAGRRYIVYLVHDAETVVIVGLFRDTMDIPTHLQALQAMGEAEIAALRRALDDGGVA